MSQAVRYERRGSVGIITVANPPVNALSQAVRQGLMDALAQGQGDGAAKALVVIGAGRTFIAGADIKEFGKPLAAPDLNAVIAGLESSLKPTIAAIHGTALGGGLEVALGCHYRVAVAAAQVGLPEVKLGILPGAGGTQRLPRLVGAKAALDMITTGEFVRAGKAKEIGILDDLVDGDLLEGALCFAENAAARDIRPPHSRARREARRRARQRRAVRGVSRRRQEARPRPAIAAALRRRRRGGRQPALRARA